MRKQAILAMQMSRRRSELRSSELRTESQIAAKQSQSCRSILTSRRLAIEQVFAATHGRDMTDTERQTIFSKIAWNDEQDRAR